MQEFSPVTNAIIDPICALCKENIGSMPLDIYQKAIARRGPYLLCPACREHKCDCCGYVYLDHKMKPSYGEGGEFLGNACRRCLHDLIGDKPTPDDFWHFFSNAKPNLRSFEAMQRAALELVRAEEGERWEQ